MNSTQVRAGLIIAAVFAMIAGVALYVGNSGSGGRTQAATRPLTPTTSTATTPHTGATSRPLNSQQPKPAAYPKPGRGQRVIVLVNRTHQVIWPAAAPNPAHPLKVTGWRLAPGQSVGFLAPDHLNSRIWARTGCVFNAAGHGHCVTGDCGGKFQCGQSWGALPATLAEFNFNAWRGMDFYDVSLVDGANLPMWINHLGGHTPDKISSTGCVPAGCTRDATATCPTVLSRYAGGTVVACLSSCLRFGTDQYCCRAHWAPRANCRPDQWPINSAAVFKRAEPFAYSYVNDDATSVFTCTGECGYRITFGTSP
jgi:hypothetical protein